MYLSLIGKSTDKGLERCPAVLLDLMNGILLSKFQARFKNGSCVFWLHIRSSHMLRPLSATRSLILNVSTCSIVCRRHDDPTNGPTGDPGMVRLP